MHHRCGENGPLSKTTIPLPSITMPQPNINIKAGMRKNQIKKEVNHSSRKLIWLFCIVVPSKIYLGEPINVTYVIDNPTISIAEYSGSIELSDAFVFSGYKQIKGQILPMTSKVYNYVCYPILTGKVRLPKLKVIAKHQGMEKEVPINMTGNGTIDVFGNDLQPKYNTITQSSTTDSDSTASSIQVFVNPRKK